MPHDAPARARLPWYGAFLAGLAANANVTAAARISPYADSKIDEEFALAWDAAIEETVMHLVELPSRAAEPAQER